MGELGELLQDQGRGGGFDIVIWWALWIMFLFFFWSVFQDFRGFEKATLACPPWKPSILGDWRSHMSFGFPKQFVFSKPTTNTCLTKWGPTISVVAKPTFFFANGFVLPKTSLVPEMQAFDSTKLLLNCDGSQDTKEEKSKQTISPAKERALNYWYKIAKQCKNAPKKTTWPRLGRPRVATSIQVAGKRNWFRFFDRVQMYQWFLGRIGSIRPWCSWKWYCCWKKKISHTLHRHFPVFARRNSYIYLNGWTVFFYQPYFLITFGQERQQQLRAADAWYGGRGSRIRYEVQWHHGWIDSLIFTVQVEAWV